MVTRAQEAAISRQILDINPALHDALVDEKRLPSARRRTFVDKALGRSKLKADSIDPPPVKALGDRNALRRAQEYLHYPAPLLDGEEHEEGFEAIPPGMDLERRGEPHALIRHFRNSSLEDAKERFKKSDVESHSKWDNLETAQAALDHAFIASQSKIKEHASKRLRAYLALRHAFKKPVGTQYRKEIARRNYADVKKGELGIGEYRVSGSLSVLQWRCRRKPSESFLSITHYPTKVDDRVGRNV